MLLRDSRMQISFLKDLVTTRNPTSEFSFISFLDAKGRLAEFINSRTVFPSRTEFHQYLEWAANRIVGEVHYGSEVVDVQPVFVDDEVAALDVHGVQAGAQVRWRARNVVVATGLVPELPAGLPGSDRIWHNAGLLNRLREEPARSANRFMVVGAGQSAAETAQWLHSQREDAQVYSVFARYGFSPADSSPFANGIFDTAAVSMYFNAPAEVKQMLLGYHRNTNYSVVDPDLIEDLHTTVYEEKVTGRRRLHLLNVSRVVSIEPGPDHVTVTVQDLSTGTVTPVQVDVVVYATGYRPSDPAEVLGQVSELCERDDEDRIRLQLDYRVVTGQGVRCGIYVQGSTEHTHGLTSSLLSNTAVRAGEIVDSVLAGEKAR
jgi:L-ornithine N5-oxygenase